MNEAVRLHQRRQANRSLTGGQYGTARLNTSPAEKRAALVGHAVRDRGGPLAFTRKPSTHEMQVWVLTGLDRKLDRLRLRIHLLNGRKAAKTAKLKDIRAKRQTAKAEGLRRRAVRRADPRIEEYRRKVERLNDAEGDVQLDLRVLRLDIASLYADMRALMERRDDHRTHNVIPLKAFSYGGPDAEPDERDRRHSGGMVGSNALNWHAK